MRYAAKIAREGKHWTIEFPDAPGCATFGDSREDALVQGREALTGWIRSYLLTGETPPAPKNRRSAHSVAVPVEVAIAVMLRRIREAEGISQALLAKRVGVSQQQIAKLEGPDANPSVATISKLAVALGREAELRFV